MSASRIEDRYEIVRPLGQGGFGVTLLARDLQLDRPVVIKVLRPRGDDGPKAYELFQREAAVLRELRHPGIPAVHASLQAPWEGADAAMLVLEYIEGTSLQALLADRRHLDVETVSHLFVEALGLLDYLHTRVPPVLHRDIKPANLLVRADGSLAFVDFGAVRNVFRSPEESGSTIVGTYGYMPYEQYMGQASPASDLYGLAATFLHLLTGRPPAEFLSPAGRVEVPAELPCGEPLRGVLARMLASAPSERPQSARAARAALLGGAGTTTLARSAPPVPTISTVLPPAPRPLEGPTRSLLNKVAYTGWQLLDPQTRNAKATGMDVGLVVFFSVLTVGILPLIIWSRARTRRRRLTPFFTDGQAAPAVVLELGREDIEFGAKLVRVRYEFEADRARHRGVDWVLPALAERWHPGDAIEVLYLPEQDFDSVIVSTR